MNFGHVNYKLREFYQFGIRAPYNTTTKTTTKKENNKYNNYYGIRALL